jgi:hypothetical protein
MKNLARGQYTMSLATTTAGASSEHRPERSAQVRFRSVIAIAAISAISTGLEPATFGVTGPLI